MEEPAEGKAKRNGASPRSDEPQDRARPAGIFAAVAFQLILAGAAGAGIWHLLGEKSTERNLIALAGFAGVVGGSLGPLLRPLPQANATDRSGTSLALSPLIYASGGSALAIGVYLVTRALLVSGGPGGVNEIGVVAFGGVVGWVAAQIIDGVLTRTWEWEPSRAITRRHEQPAVVAALSEIDEKLFGRPLQNYDGYVRATWHAPAPGSSLAGRFRTQFIPRIGPEDSPQTVEVEDDVKDRPTATATARVLVQGGVDVDEPLFSVSIIHRGLDAYPPRIHVKAPLNRPSEPVEFTTIAGPLLERSGGSADEDAVADSFDAALVEISQGGQTIQLLELPTTKQPDTAP